MTSVDWVSMILGGAAMDLNFIRRTSLPSFSSCLFVAVILTFEFL